MQLPYDIYHNRVQENIETFRKDYEEHRSIRASEFHFYEKDKYEKRRLFEFENSWDIIGATLVADLPSNNPDGADGFRLLPSGEYIEMEYKISRKSQNSIWQTSRGSLYTGKANIKNQTTSLRSGFAASFEIQNNLLSKNRLTNLFIFDETLQQFVCGYQLTGEQVIEALGLNGDSERAIKRTIKLSRFINFGAEIDLTVPSYGSYIEWESMLREHVQILKTGEYRLDN